MVNEDGSINHRYFLDTPGRYWSEQDQAQLLQGIGEFGVGEHHLIQEKYLPQKTFIDVKLRTCLLLGIYDITDYYGYKDVETFEQIRQKNLEHAAQTGKLKHGIYLNLE